MYSGRREDAESLHDELESLSSRLGHVFALWVSYIDQLHYKILDGDLPGLESRGQKILDWARTVGIPWGIRQTLGLLSLGELWGGRQEAALELAHESVEEEGSELPVSSRATLMLVQAYGGGSDALRQLDALELPTSGVENDLGKQTALLFAAPALAVLGEDDRAAELYPLMREPLENMKSSPFGALMPETAAGIAAACGRSWDAAEAHFRTALRYAREIPHKLEEPQIRYWYAKMLIGRSASGDRERARELLSDAIEGYRSIGMPLYLEMAEELRAKL